ncbi:MAG: chromosome segregation protein SMC, partial [Alphaproteobacteria bacterium]
ARAAQDAIVAARGAAREALEAQRMLAQGREARAGIAAALRAWEAVATLAAARRERALLLGGAPTKAHRDAARDAAEAARRAFDGARVAETSAVGVEAAALATREAARMDAAAAAERRGATALARDEALARAGIDAPRAALFVAEGEAAGETLARRSRAAEDAAARAQARLAEARGLLEAHRGAGRPARDAAALGVELAAGEAAHGAAQERVGEIGALLGRDDEARARRARLGAALEDARKAAETWDAVDKAIGSQTGARFRNFAQRYTFESLLALANEQLASILPRYRLRPAAATGLSLHVLDRHMGDEVRAPRSLSGGERFLLALALALGLSRLGAGRSVVETLFIDEG